MDRFTKIVATLGPASSDESILRRLIEAGLDVARLNFSHGTLESHAALIASLRKLSEELSKPVTILQDLQGPKLRVGDIPAGGVELAAGQMVLLIKLSDYFGAQVAESGEILIPMDVPLLAESMQAGDHILMDDGHLELEVTGLRAGAVEARVVLGGLLTSNKGVNLPGTRLDIPVFTEKDRQDLEFGLSQGVDAVAISFVRSAGDVEIVRRAIGEISSARADTPLIAKLEVPQAIENLDEILQAADGVMVARGDLAVETSPAVVPIVQKKIIAAANRQARLVITATQMLESMIENPRPTRAEASDVANAIFDGSDAVMLSAESAIGRYPVESVAMMDGIARHAEQHLDEWGFQAGGLDELTRDDAISVTLAARELAHDRRVSRIAVFTRTGRTALLVSKARPRVPILAFTPEPRTYQRLGLYRGVTPYLVPYAADTEEMLAHVEDTILGSLSLASGQQVVLISSFPVGEQPRLPNFALLHTIASGEAEE